VYRCRIRIDMDRIRKTIGTVSAWVAGSARDARVGVGTGRNKVVVSQGSNASADASPMIDTTGTDPYSQSTVIFDGQPDSTTIGSFFST
jgi:hypothetical protein